MEISGAGGRGGAIIYAKPRMGGWSSHSVTLVAAVTQKLSNLHLQAPVLLFSSWLLCNVLTCHSTRHSMEIERVAVYISNPT